MGHYDENALEVALAFPAAGKTRGVGQEEIAVLALAEVVAARQKRGRSPVVEQPAVIFATDRVCGMTVDPLTSTHKAIHDGMTFWFCSARGRRVGWAAPNNCCASAGGRCWRSSSVTSPTSRVASTRCSTCSTSRGFPPPR
jgi:hypothetical protein